MRTDLQDISMTTAQTIQWEEKNGIDGGKTKKNGRSRFFIFIKLNCIILVVFWK